MNALQSLNYPKVVLKKGKEQSLKRFHPWVFSGAIQFVEPEAQDGDVVQVQDAQHHFLGVGHLQSGSIAVRILSFQPELIDHNFWLLKLKNALDLRKSFGFNSNANTNVYRLCFAEGDGLPGINIDVFENVAILQSYTMGMHLAKGELVNALVELYNGQLQAVYDKSAETMSRSSAWQINNEFLFGTSTAKIVKENGHFFNIDWVKGQKTVFFIDQRENRTLLKQFAKGKKVLNTFCYSGGFSVYAAAGGAEKVHSVDVSQAAIDLCKDNLLINGFDAAEERYRCIAMDTFEYLKSCAEKYDIIVLDPPAFAKSRKVSHNAIMGYRRLNSEAIKSIQPGGFLFTYSCSQVINRDLFNSAVTAAAIDVGRNVRIIAEMGQAIDHPVSIFNPEGEYLKGLLLAVD